MAKRKVHSDVEFAVGTYGTTKTTIYKNAEEASAIAIARSVSGMGDQVIDVLIYSRAGARWFGGDDAAAIYEEDPDASVYDRIVVRAESHGRIR